MNSADDRLRANTELAEAEARDGEDLHETLGPTATAPPLELSVSYPVPAVCVVEVAGELDMLTARVLADCVQAQLTAGPVQLVIDLEAVTFLGSAGMGTLLECSRWLEATVPGSTMHLSGTHRRNIRRPLELVGLLPLFNAHTTLPEALAQLGAQPETKHTAPNADTSTRPSDARQASTSSPH
jgi:anti-anti-sigma factor